MHAYKVGKTTFVANSDLSGDIRIVAEDGADFAAPTKNNPRAVLVIPGDDLLAFVAMRLGDRIRSAIDDISREDMIAMMRDYLRSKS